MNNERLFKEWDEFKNKKLARDELDGKVAIPVHYSAYYEMRFYQNPNSLQCLIFFNIFQMIENYEQ